MEEEEKQEVKEKTKAIEDNKTIPKNLQSNEEEDQKYFMAVKEGTYKDKHYKKYDKDHIEFTAFDLIEENDEGYFDNNNFYVNYKEKADPWYDSVKDEAKEKELLQKKTQRAKTKEDKDNESSDSSPLSQKEKEEKDISKYGDEDLYYIEERVTEDESKEIKAQIKEQRLLLVDMLMSNNERVNQAIKRLTPRASKGKKTTSEHKLPSDIFDKLLSIVSKLTELAYFDVYSDSISKIVRDYGEESIIKWKYKTVNRKDGKEEQFGLFTTEEMVQWNNSKYFEDDETISLKFCANDPRDRHINQGGENSNEKGNNLMEEVWFDKKDELFKLYFNKSNYN